MNRAMVKAALNLIPTADDFFADYPEPLRIGNVPHSRVWRITDAEGMQIRTYMDRRGCENALAQVRTFLERAEARKAGK